MMDRCFSGKPEQRGAVRAALRLLHSKRISDQRIANLLATYLNAGRIPEYPRSTTPAVSRATIQRVRVCDDRALLGIRPMTIGLLYNFLCQCGELKTDLYDDTVIIRSSHPMAPLLESLQRHLKAHGGPLSNQSMRSLEGTFHLYRKAWTSPNAPTYIRSILSFNWSGDALFYKEEQSYFDDVAQLPVNETDHGVVHPFGMNVVLIGKDSQKDLLKFFSIHDLTPYPDGHQQVHAFTGNFIAVYSKGPHPGFRAYALRVDSDEASCGFLHQAEVDEMVLQCLVS